MKIVGQLKKQYPPRVEWKILFAFPDAILDAEAETVTMNWLDVIRLLERLDYLESPPSISVNGEIERRDEPPKFRHYREGGWMDRPLYEP